MHEWEGAMLWLFAVKRGLMEGGKKMRNYKKFMVLLMASALIIALVPPLFAQEGKNININQAPADELTQLRGIGAKYAARIVQFREANGPFTCPEDIMKVPGIGVKIFEANKTIITVE
jgi:competence protein ComEA